MSDSPKVEAVRPRGLMDRAASEIAAADAMIAKIREVYALYGFEAVETPFVEYTHALGKFLPDLDRPNEGVFSFQDDDEQWLSLRYDLTAPLARYVAEHFEKLPKPYRSFRSGWVFRNEKPGPGRFRQFMQFDADTVGSSSPAADAEMCMMAADCLEALGIPRGSYVVKVNNRKVLDGVMEAIGLGGAENAGRRLTVLRAIDKLDRLGLEGVRALLGAGRKDESGDFTKGAGLVDGQVHEISTLLGSQPELIEVSDLPAWEQADARSAPESPTLAFKNSLTVAKLRAHFGGSNLIEQGLDELAKMADLFESAEIGSRRILIDPSVVRGLEYYTGSVFEAEVFLKDTSGKPISFGSIGGGGRYDGLVARFRPEPVPATGFSIGVSRLLAALKAIDSPIVKQSATPGPVVVLAMDRDRMADYQKLVKTLRDANIPAEIYLGEGKMNAQLKYADKRGSLCAVIQGSNEREAAGGPQVVIRDLALGAELAKANKDRADYLEMRARAQVTVAEAELVERVRSVIARGGAPVLG